MSAGRVRSSVARIPREGGPIRRIPREGGPIRRIPGPIRWAVVPLAAIVVLAGAPVYAGHLTVKASDIVNNAIRPRHISKDAVRPKQIAEDAVRSQHIQDGAVTGSKVAPNSLGGAQVDEAALDYASAGCKKGLVQGHARVRGAADMPDTFTTSSQFVDLVHNCSGGDVEVRRVAEGHYEVRFLGTFSVAAVTGAHTGGRIPAAITQGTQGSLSVTLRRADTGALTEGSVLVVIF